MFRARWSDSQDTAIEIGAITPIISADQDGYLGG
jgi:hypothetical protein